MVFLDTNGNGVRDGDEVGIRGVQIVLTEEGSAITVRTGDDGRYRFGGLAPGSYTVSATQQAGYRFFSTPDEVTLTLAAGETRSVDFGVWNGRPLYLPLVLR